MKKVIKHYPMTGRLIVTRGYFKDKNKYIENCEKNALFILHFSVFFIKKRMKVPLFKAYFFYDILNVKCSQNRKINQ